MKSKQLISLQCWCHSTHGACVVMSVEVDSLTSAMAGYGDISGTGGQYSQTTPMMTLSDCLLHKDFFLAENTFFHPLILMFYLSCLLTYFSIIYCIKITFSSVFLIERNDIPIIQNTEIIPISLLFVNSKGTSTCHS